jgi:hypothetical protein
VVKLLVFWADVRVGSGNIGLRDEGLAVYFLLRICLKNAGVSIQSAG